MTRIPGEEPKRCHSENGDMPILQNGDSHLTKESLQNGLGEIYIHSSYMTKASRAKIQALLARLKTEVILNSLLLTSVLSYLSVINVTIK